MPQEVRDPLQSVIIGGQDLRVVVGEFAKLGLGPFQSAAQFQIAAVGLGQEVGDGTLHHPQTKARQVHVLDHFRIEKADGVAGDGIAKAGVEFLGHGCAAHHAAAFDQTHLQARPGQIKGAGQPIMASADDQDVRRARRGGGHEGLRRNSLFYKRTTKGACRASPLTPPHLAVYARAWP